MVRPSDDGREGESTRRQEKQLKNRQRRLQQQKERLRLWKLMEIPMNGTALDVDDKIDKEKNTR